MASPGVQVTISIPKAPILATAFARFPEEMAPVLRDAVMQSAFQVEREAKLVVPVRTGRLRASIAVSLGIANAGLSSVVQTNVNYANTVHEGLGYGKNSVPRRFMLQGAEAAKDNIERFFTIAIERATALLNA